MSWDIRMKFISVEFPKCRFCMWTDFVQVHLFFTGPRFFRSLAKNLVVFTTRKLSYISLKKSRSTYMNRIINLYYISQNKFIFGRFWFISLIVDALKSFLFWTENAVWGSFMFFFTSVNETAEEQIVVLTTLEVCIHKSTLMWFSYSCINNIGTKQNLQSEFSDKSPDISCTGTCIDLQICS